MRWTTPSGKRLGTTGAFAIVHSIIPFDDPNRAGNLGLEGADDDFDRRYFPTAGLAQAWAARKLKGEEHAADAQIERVRWTDSSFYDDRNGDHVTDADPTVEFTREGWIRDGETEVTWGEWDEPARY